MKFKLRKDISKIVYGVTVYQIEYLKGVGPIKKGELTGWLEKETNLSQSNNACVYGDACVYDEAYVSGDACVFDNVRVYGDACVYGDASVYGNSRVSNNARVYGDACVYGNAYVYDNACVCGYARVYGDAIVSNEKECINIILPFKNSITITKYHIQIGCEIHTIKHWKKEIKNIGKKHNYTEEEIKAVIFMLKAAFKMRS